MKVFQAKYFHFWKKKKKSVPQRCQWKIRQTQTHVLSSENKSSVIKNLNLAETSTTIDADMETFLLSFLVLSFYPLTQKNEV